MKRIIVNENQAKLIMESSPMKNVGNVFMCDGNNPFSLTNYFVGSTIDRMAKKRADEINGFFIDDISSFSKDKVFSKLNRLITICKQKEEPFRDKLSKICSNVVVETFGIDSSESLKLTCEVVNEIPRGESFHIKPDTDEDFEYDSIDAMESSDVDVNKRRIINALAYGAANRIAEQSKKLWVSDIFELDEDLPHLYSQIMKINEYLVFTTNVELKDESHKQGGTVDVKLSNENGVTEISSKGIIFPILLHETIRGIMECLSSYGLPDDVETAKRITNVADALENDPWNMRFGPAIWDAVCAGINDVKTEEIPYFFKDLVSLDAQEFQNVMREVIAGTKAGKEKIASIYNQSKYNNEYDRFKSDLALKQGRDVIEDDYFTEEELEEGIFEFDDGY